MSEREFKDLRGGENHEGGSGRPVDEFMDGLEALQAEIATAKNVLWERVADGTLSEGHLKRLCKEYYFLGKWLTTEFGTLVSSVRASMSGALETRDPNSAVSHLPRK